MTEIQRQAAITQFEKLGESLNRLVTQLKTSQSKDLKTALILTVEAYTNGNLNRIQFLEYVTKYSKELEDLK